MVKSMQFQEATRQPSVQSSSSQANQSRRRSHRASSALTLLLAVQACSLGTVVSARPGIVMGRSESASSLSASTATIVSSSVVQPTPYQSNEAKSRYRQAEVTQEHTSYSATQSTQPSSAVTAIARSIGEFPTVTISSSIASTTTSSSQSEDDAPVLLRQADPATSTSMVTSTAMATFTSSAAAFDVQPSATETSFEPSQPTSIMSTDDSKEVTEAENEGNNVQRRDVNDDDEDSDSASSDSGSSSESCASDEENDQYHRQENVQGLPITSALDTTLPLKRYAAVYDAALTARSFDDFVESVEQHSKRSWFDDDDMPHKMMQKDDGAMYSAMMKRMIDSHQKQIDIHKRLLDLVTRNIRRQEEKPTQTSSPPASTEETAFPIVSNYASPQEAQKRNGHSQWEEHEHQCICTPTPSASAAATTTTTMSRKRQDDPNEDQKRHQLLSSAMSDWTFVSGWLSSRLPANLHKQVVEALQQQSSNN